MTCGTLPVLGLVFALYTLGVLGDGRQELNPPSPGDHDHVGRLRLSRRVSSPRDGVILVRKMYGSLAYGEHRLGLAFRRNRAVRHMRIMSSLTVTTSLSDTTGRRFGNSWLAPDWLLMGLNALFRFSSMLRIYRRHTHANLSKSRSLRIDGGAAIACSHRWSRPRKHVARRSRRNFHRRARSSHRRR